MKILKRVEPPSPPPPWWIGEKVCRRCTSTILLEPGDSVHLVSNERIRYLCPACGHLNDVLKHEPAFFRAGGELECTKCARALNEHSPSPDYPWLIRDCNGDLWKL